MGVAQNANTPAESLARLAQDVGHYVRVYVGRHKNTPVEVLRELANDPDEGVRNVAMATLSRLSDAPTRA